MKVKVVIEPFYEGRKTQFLTIRKVDELISEGEKFFLRHKKTSPESIRQISLLITKMADVTGAPDHFFRQEGTKADHVMALPATPSELRLYCLRFGNICVIIGGGGVKPENVRTYQEVPELFSSVKALQSLNKALDTFWGEEIYMTDAGLEYPPELELEIEIESF